VDEFRTSCKLYENRMQMNKPDTFMREIIKSGYRPTIIFKKIAIFLNKWKFKHKI